MGRLALLQNTVAILRRRLIRSAARFGILRLGRRPAWLWLELVIIPPDITEARQIAYDEIAEFDAHIGRPNPGNAARDTMNPAIGVQDHDILPVTLHQAVTSLLQGRDEALTVPGSLPCVGDVARSAVTTPPGPAFLLALAGIRTSLRSRPVAANMDTLDVIETELAL
jgi:hypothetical protein